MSVYGEWCVIFPGKMGLSWKIVTSYDSKEEAETAAAKNCNTVIVPTDLYVTMKENEHRMVAAESKLNEFRIRQDYEDGKITYTELDGYGQRVIREKIDLDNKLKKLTKFTATGTFNRLSLDEQCLLNRQNAAMQEYSKILGDRIGKFQEVK